VTQRTQEVLIGLVVLLGLVLLAVLIALFGEFRELFRESYPVQVRFSTASGVRPGTPVFITGVEVGSVEDVTLEEEGVIMSLAIDTRYGIARDSAVAIRRKGILADPFIEFTRGDSTKTLPQDGSVTLSGQVSPSIDEAAHHLQSLAARIDAILGDEELQQNFRTTLANLAQLSGRGTEVLDRARALADELRRFVDLSSQLVDETRLLSSDLRTHLDHQSRNLDRLTEGLVKNSEELNRSLASASDILQDIRRGQGSVGKLLTQDELYRQLVDTIAETRQTVGQLGEMITYFREHPEVLVWGTEPETKESLDLWPF